MSRDDGWGAHEGPVTGGEGAAPAHVYLVRNRKQLVQALAAGGDTGPSAVPKIIRIEGVIDLSSDDSGRALTEDHYRDAAFSWDAFALAYDPASWGRRAPAGALEDARQRSAARQAAVVVLAVGANTSLIGMGQGALIKNGGLLIKDAHNVLIRNLAFEDAYDYFPAWDPDDNRHGEWNAAYDNVTLHNARRVWIDHCSFSDGARPDHRNRALLGRPMQFHDGLLDIVRGSDLVTISNSHFRNHDKGMLIGNSDSRKEDDGRLRVTLHGNWFEDVKERSPRVRFGRVHVYNNLYSAMPGADYPYGYSVGVGFGARIIAEHNAFELASGERAFRWWKGERIQATGNRLQAGSGVEIDAAAQLEKQAGMPIAREAGWQVPYRYVAVPAGVAAEQVRSRAGAGR